MEHEANLLERIATIFDDEMIKADVTKRCDVCDVETKAVSLCKRCAVRSLRELATHLRRYL